MLTHSHALPVVSQSVNAVSHSHRHNVSHSHRHNVSHSHRHTPVPTHTRTGYTAGSSDTKPTSNAGSSFSSSSSSLRVENKEYKPAATFKDLIMALPDPNPSKTIESYRNDTVSSKFVLLADNNPRKPFTNIVDNNRRLRPVTEDVVCDKCGAKGDHDSDQCRYFAIDQNPFYNYVGNQRK